MGTKPRECREEVARDISFPGVKEPCRRLRQGAGLFGARSEKAVQLEGRSAAISKNERILPIPRKFKL
eukprot:1557971-Rhodomonas_salina.1